MTDTKNKKRQRRPEGPFSDELIDQLLAHARGKDEALRLCLSRHAFFVTLSSLRFSSLRPSRHRTAMAIVGMNHFTVLTDDLDKSREFYMGVLGLEEGYRPPLGFPGAWLYSGGRAVLHIIAGRALPEPRSGVLDHMAFSARDLSAVVEKLKERGIQYDLRRQRESRTWQLFCFDPSGARVELDFDPSEPGPER